MIYIPSWLHILLYTVLCISLNAQTKFEREVRIRESEAPSDAVRFIQEGNFTTRVKWYRELSHDGLSFEAKGRKNGLLYSIEFNSVGNPIDIERTVRFNDLPPVMQTRIASSLESVFETYRILKTQIQWTGSPRALLELLQQGTTELQWHTAYEIVLSGRQNRQRAMYEVLIDPSGEIINIATIVLRKTDHLDF